MDGQSLMVIQILTLLDIPKHLIKNTQFPIPHRKCFRNHSIKKQDGLMKNQPRIPKLKAILMITLFKLI